MAFLVASEFTIVINDKIEVEIRKNANFVAEKWQSRLAMLDLLSHFTRKYAELLNLYS